MNVRRSAAVLAAVAVFGSAAAPAAFAESASPSPSAALPSGLYGDADPKFDGVFRQSYALLAQDSAGVKPAAKSVDWLTGQQCASGGFAAYRADAGEPCDSKTMFDSNATASAVQALAALGGQDKAVKKSVGWLKSVQNKDGGWGYGPGMDSDANSTGIVIGALTAAGEKPQSVKNQDGKSPYDALPALSMSCGKDGGAFGLADMKTGKLFPNADATAAGVLGAHGKGLIVDPANKEAATPKCAKADTAEQAAANGTGYLLKTLAKTDDHLMSALPGTKVPPDVGNTADSVLALAAAGQQKQAEKSAQWLAKNSAEWAKKSGPAAYAQLIFAAHAAGMDPRDFGGADLVKQLNAQGPAPQATDQAADEKKDSDDGSGVSIWWIIGVGMVAGIGIGFLYSGNKKKQQL
ncbi:terpene cyclase/mutase family protein [Streptomyces durmitorensis]|uniref:Terpene cyclase/mutase family protein n=1 Tax=Streptomyces durmitorensis TaxID=319947 RepID=A0ABY4Q161_9ACTN|nr:prenyltransferase/squalene oxidase repeat-containing protein [Streptomyces durmitorensis]UQT58813.1 terpene cyclase/mutase family protein [Streptomyces durmitorensis]